MHWRSPQASSMHKGRMQVLLSLLFCHLFFLRIPFSTPYSHLAASPPHPAGVSLLLQALQVCTVPSLWLVAPSFPNLVVFLHSMFLSFLLFLYTTIWRALFFDLVIVEVMADYLASCLAPDFSLISCTYLSIAFIFGPVCGLPHHILSRSCICS